jgi:Abnormal spindle-like microcephaly-assoc'd, ASPM-SPD-2-Hydin
MALVGERIRRRFCHLSLALVLLAGGAFTDAAAGGRICPNDDTFTFGNRAVGSTTTANATVTNCGDAPWSFTDVSVHPATGPAFQVSTTCTTGLTLAPGGTCTMSVRFAPTTPGQTSGGLWLHNTTPTPDQLITFYGRGVDGQNGSASLAFVPAKADFAAQAVGTQSTAVILELHNQGPAALTLSAIVLNGPEVYDFLGFDDTCQVGAAIAAGDSDGGMSDGRRADIPSVGRPRRLQSSLYRRPRDSRPDSRQGMGGGGLRTRPGDHVLTAIMRLTYSYRPSA